MNRFCLLLQILCGLLSFWLTVQRCFGQEAAGCSQQKRVYANNNAGVGNYRLLPANLGGDASVEDKSNAFDGSPDTYSLLTSTSLLGIGGAQQTICWEQTIPSNTTVYVKIGITAELLGLVSSITLQPKNNIDNVGSALSLGGGVVNLLAGENDIIFSFTTTNVIDRIMLKVTGTLTLGKRLKFYDAWYMTSGTECSPKDVVDILAGSAELIKGVLNATSATVNVNNHWSAADNDDDTFAEMNSGLGVAAYAKMDVIFSSLSQPGDSIFIKIQSAVETVNLIGGFSIQRYMGNTAVGTPLDFDGSILSLLQGTDGHNIIFTVTTEPYDRISIRYGGVANVLGQLRVYEIQRRPFIYNHAFSEAEVYLCEGNQISVGLDISCLQYDWYDSSTGGTLKHTGIYTGDGSPAPYIPSLLGRQIYYIQHVRNGCAFGPRMPFAIYVLPRPGKPHLTIRNVIN